MESEVREAVATDSWERRSSFEPGASRRLQSSKGCAAPGRSKESVASARGGEAEKRVARAGISAALELGVEVETARDRTPMGRPLARGRHSPCGGQAGAAPRLHLRRRPVKTDRERRGAFEERWNAPRKAGERRDG
jgi:hypothetical protein